MARLNSVKVNMPLDLQDQDLTGVHPGTLWGKLVGMWQATVASGTAPGFGQLSLPEQPMAGRRKSVERQSAQGRKNEEDRIVRGVCNGAERLIFRGLRVRMGMHCGAPASCIRYGGFAADTGACTALLAVIDSDSCSQVTLSHFRTRAV